MMDRIKELLSLIVGSRLEVSGTGRTYVNLPTWLVALAALSSLHLAVLTVLLMVSFGMRARLVKA